MTAYSIIFVGGKPFMNYVTSVVMQFQQHQADKVTVKARGKFISRAVDVAEVVCKRFLDDKVAVNDISISSEAFTTEEGKQVRVSTITIVLEREGEQPSQTTLEQ